VLIFTFILSVNSFGDTPLLAPEEKRVCDLWMNYCAYIHPEEGTTVYSVKGAFNLTKLYDIPGWHRSAHVSFNGEYFVSGYNGLNLVPLDISNDKIMITIWKNGVMHKEIKFGQLIRDMRKLERTSSHYHWGSIEMVNASLLYLDTVDNRIVVNLESGLVEHYEVNKPLNNDAKNGAH